jgi:FkbM family methyltransferase
MSRNSTSLTLQRVLFNLLSRTRLLHPIVRRIWPAVRLEVGGHDLILHPADNATERYMWLHGTRREVASIGRLTLLVAGKRSLIFDIGANCGAFTLPLAAATGARSRIIAFEPNPVMAMRLRRNLVLNGLDSRVELQEVALGPRDGNTDLWIRARNLGLSSLHSSDHASARAILVPVRQLVRFLPPSGHPYEIFVIKCDVEGFEDQALGPFLKSAAEDCLPDAILAETTNSDCWAWDLLGLMRHRGYATYFPGEDGNTLFLKTPKS